jgi:hypothetical protein
MQAFLLTLLLVAFWSVVGFALLSAWYTRRNLLQSALLAPSMGIAATVLLITWVSLLGAPLRYGGPAATLALLVLSAWLFRKRRPILPSRRLAPFILIAVLAAVITGFPMFKFGFDWVSYCNDDMANYALGAKFFLNHGHFDVPTLAEIDLDASYRYWLMYVPAGIRHGVEELLSWACSITGLSAPEAFMPMILAFHITLIASIGALVLQNRKLRSAALFATCGLAFSALVTLGTLYQLFAQVSGLAMLASTLALLLRPPPTRRRELIICALLAAGACLIYPEMLPFLGISFIIYHAQAIWRGRETLTQVLRGFGAISVASVLFLNAGAIITITTLFGQAVNGLKPVDPLEALFPYYLTPSGLAYLWGFAGIGEGISENGMDRGIVVGAILLVVAIVITMRGAWSGQPIAIVTAVMLALSLRLFESNTDFGLFKLAMYLQPFLLGTLAVSLAGFYRRIKIRPLKMAVILGPILLIYWGTGAQRFYITRSFGEGGGGLVEIPYASSQHLLSRLKSLPADGRWVATDTSNVVLGKLEAYYQSPTLFLCKNFFENISDNGNLFWSPIAVLYRQSAQVLLLQILARIGINSFDMHGAIPSPNHFVLQQRAFDRSLPILEGGSRTTILNRRSHSNNDPALVTRVPQENESNFLVFVASEFGNDYYFSGRDRFLGRISMYQVEGDFYFPSRSMTSLGRDSVFQALGASPRVRLSVEYTASLNGDGNNAIPPASAIGDDRYPFVIRGRGSARLFSAAMNPQRIQKGNYVALDMGTWGQQFPDRRSYLMNLWGKSFRYDSRKIVGFARDISLISDEEYQSLNPPRSIERFPADLGNKNLEYCGIYEDGWVAEDSYTVLLEPPGSSVLNVSAMVPALPGKPAASRITIALDGRDVKTQPVRPGPVSVDIPLQGEGKHRIDIRFDRAAGLPSPDNRPVSALLQHVGFR